MLVAAYSRVLYGWPFCREEIQEKSIYSTVMNYCSECKDNKEEFTEFCPKCGGPIEDFHFFYKYEVSTNLNLSTEVKDDLKKLLNSTKSSKREIIKTILMDFGGDFRLIEGYKNSFIGINLSEQSTTRTLGDVLIRVDFNQLNEVKNKFEGLGFNIENVGLFHTFY